MSAWDGPDWRTLKPVTWSENIERAESLFRSAFAHETDGQHAKAHRLFEAALATLPALTAQMEELERELVDWKEEAERRGLPRELMQRLHRAEASLRKIIEEFRSGSGGYEENDPVVIIARAALPNPIPQRTLRERTRQHDHRGGSTLAGLSRGLEPVRHTLRQLRERRELSLRALETLTGLSRGVLSEIETGSRVPTPAQLHVLAEFYGVAADGWQFAVLATAEVAA